MGDLRAIIRALFALGREAREGRAPVGVYPAFVEGVVALPAGGLHGTGSATAFRQFGPWTPGGYPYPGTGRFAGRDTAVARWIGGLVMPPVRTPEDFEHSCRQMVLALARTIDARDVYTAGHSERLAEWAGAVTRALGCGEDEVEEIRWGALLHDIGKIGVPDHILWKPGPLTDDEWAVIRQHPVIGESILLPVERMRRVMQLVRFHQERWDGKGYPDGLRTQQIPLGARVIAVLDAYSAIIDDRPYRSGRSVGAALLELQRCAGTQFDPGIVEVFCRLVERADVAAPHPDPEWWRGDGYGLSPHGGNGYGNGHSNGYRPPHAPDRIA